MRWSGLNLKKIDLLVIAVLKGCGFEIQLPMFVTVFATRDWNIVQINFESVPLLFIAFVRKSLYPTSTCLDY